jgi:flagellar motor component MotA
MGAINAILFISRCLVRLPGSGILWFFQPLATGIETMSSNEACYILALKGVTRLASDAPPIVAVEFARRAIFSDVRPSFKEMEDAFRNKK